MTTRAVPAALAPAIDLRPLFAPRSIAVLGASPRNTIGLTLRDNLQRMGYTNVISMDGGWRGWTGAGMPVERG